MGSPKSPEAARIRGRGHRPAARQGLLRGRAVRDGSTRLGTAAGVCICAAGRAGWFVCIGVAGKLRSTQLNSILALIACGKRSPETRGGEGRGGPAKQPRANRPRGYSVPPGTRMSPRAPSSGQVRNTSMFRTVDIWFGACTARTNNGLVDTCNVSAHGETETTGSDWVRHLHTQNIN